MASERIFIWNGWHIGDVVILRPLIQHILNEHDVTVAVGCYHNHAYMFDRLGVEVISCKYDDEDDPAGPGPLDLSYLCPKGYTPLSTWVGNYPDLMPPSWPTTIEAVNRQAAEQGLTLRLKSNLVHDINFAHINVCVRENGVYIENGKVRSGHSAFEFNMQRLSRDFPSLNFYCVSDPIHYSGNLFDCRKLTIDELAAVANRCVALVGKGSGPFVCTLSDANRYKPRAIMCFQDPTGVQDSSTYRFWDYPNSPLEYLFDYKDLAGFLTRIVERKKITLL